MTRTRTVLDGIQANGYWKSKGGIPCRMTQFNLPTWWKERETCNDEVLLGDNHPFDVTKHQLVGAGASVDGEICGGGIGDRIRNWYPDVIRNFTSYNDHLAIPGRPDNGALAAKLLALTSPSRPVVDLPIAVFELRELPHLLKGYGDSFLKSAARANLTYQFGIRPFISDLSSLLNFQDEYAKRTRELETLSQGGFRRKRTLFGGSNSEFVAGFQTHSANPGSTFHDRSKLTVERTWGFVRWKPTANSPKTDSERRRAARRAVLGLTVDFSTAWNAMPWSWLIDWCSSVGDFLAASRNIVPATPTDICIMSHRTTVTTFRRSTSNPGSFPNIGNPKVIHTNCGDFTANRETKSRSPATPTLSAHLPFLSLRQLSILASIGISKYRR
jgi:hypothetical protein